jgi:two-component system response regulator HydG
VLAIRTRRRPRWADRCQPDSSRGINAHLRDRLTTGEYHLDIAVPIFDGKAGTLRLGFSEKPYRAQLQRLWVQMALSTLGILMFALGGSLYFIRRITGPVTELARAANRVDQGELDVRVGVQGQDEVAALASRSTTW